MDLLVTKQNSRRADFKRRTSDLVGSRLFVHLLISFRTLLLTLKFQVDGNFSARYFLIVVQ